MTGKYVVYWLNTLGWYLLCIGCMLGRLVSGLCRVYPLIEGFPDTYLVLFNLVVPV